MDESWKPVPGYEGLYEVSDLGRVKSLSRKVRSGVGSRTLRERILAQDTANNGYLRVSLCRDGRKKEKMVHSLVLAAFRGPRPPGKVSCHDSGIKSDNRLSRLRYDTQSGNLADREIHGTINWASKISGAQALEIFRAKGKMRLRELADLHNISITTVSDIWNRKTWVRITGTADAADQRLLA